MRRILGSLATLIVLISALAKADASLPGAVENADHLFQGRSYSEAARAYESIIDHDPTPPGAARLYFNLGTAYRELGSFDRAQAAYTAAYTHAAETLARLPMYEDAYYSYKAHWRIAQILFAQKRFESSLAEFRLAQQNYRSPGFCGNYEKDFRHQLALNLAVLHENLDRYPEAVATYLTQGNAHRLLELYTAAGQVDDLRKLVLEEDSGYAKYMTKLWSERNLDERGRVGHSVLYNEVQRVLTIREMERLGDWKSLMEILDPAVGVIHEGDEVEEAARVVSRHPADTLPLLRAVLEKPEWAYLPGGCCHALGLIGSTEAVGLLTRKARDERNYGRLLRLVDALLLAGGSGAAALEELYPDSVENLRLILDRHRAGSLLDPGRVTDPNILPYPTIPKYLRLPSRCSEDGHLQFTCESPDICR